MITAYLIVSIAIVLLQIMVHRPSANTLGATLFPALQVGLTAYAWIHLGETDSQFFTFDATGVLLLTLLTVVYFPVMGHSRLYLLDDEADRHSRAIYFAFLWLLVISLSLGYLSNHIAMTWVFTEVTTLSAAMLIYHHRNKLALEGTWKYVFICAISVTFIFIGILFLSLSLLHAGSVDLSYANLMACASRLDPVWTKLAFIFIFTGYTAKMGLFPMFTAGIDAKDNAPAPAAALLSTALVNLGFTGIFRSYAVINATGDAQWCRLMLTVVALFTLFVATVYMLKTTNIKRLLAYSGIEQMSIVCLGMVMGPVGLAAAFLHIVMHTFVKSGLFLHYSQLYRTYGSKMTEDMGEYFKLHPFGAIVLLLGVVSISAVPPSGLFVSEFLIFKEMLVGGHYLVFGLAALFLTVLLYAFLRSLLRIVFLPMREGRQSTGIAISPWESADQLLLFVLAVYVGYNPPAFLLDLIQSATSLL